MFILASEAVVSFELQVCAYHQSNSQSVITGQNNGNTDFPGQYGDS